MLPLAPGAMRLQTLPWAGLADNSFFHSFNKYLLWDFRGSPVVKTVLPMQGAWVRSPVKELRSHMLHSKINK